MRLPLKEYEVDTLVEFIELLIDRTIIEHSSEHVEDSVMRAKARGNLKEYLMELIGEYEEPDDPRRI